VSDVVDLRPYAVVGAKPCCGTNLQSAKTSSTARNKNRHYSWETRDVKHFEKKMLNGATGFLDFGSEVLACGFSPGRTKRQASESWIISQPLLSLNS
jgi:hypothetical protein